MGQGEEDSGMWYTWHKGRERGHIVWVKRRVNAALCEKIMPGETSPLP